jgi:hypothetical protein
VGLFSSISKGFTGILGSPQKVLGDITGANAAADAASQASALQAGLSREGIAEQRRQFDALQSLLAPFVKTGTSALGGQADILGLNGADAQMSSISAIQNSPQFSTLLKSGENAILQNASATGGLRGGNTQSALMEYSPTLLSKLIEQQYSRLGGLTSIGQNSAAQTGNAGMQTGVNIANLLGQQGAAQAGGIMAQGGLQRQIFSDALNLGTTAAKAFF